MNETENKVLNCAFKVFLLYGYHATTLQQIAKEARVNQATIHYYFRTKENLYSFVIEYLINLVISNDVDNIENIGKGKIVWFLNTEQYNNKILFEKNMEKLFQSKSEDIIGKIQNFIYCND